MVHIEQTPLSSIARMVVYENSRKLPLSQIVEEQQPDIALTAVFYNPKTWKPLCPVKKGGEVLYQDSQYDYWALAWEQGADAAPLLVPRGSSGATANYVANCLLVREGKPQPKLYYGSDVGGSRGRIGVGLTYRDQRGQYRCWQRRQRRGVMERKRDLKYVTGACQPMYNM